MPRAKEAKKRPLVGKAPLGSLPADKGTSAATARHDYAGMPTTAGEWTFIGHPRGDKAGKALVLAPSGKVSVEIDADECSPTGRSNPQCGREYRQRYFRNHPRELEGNP